MNYIDPDFPLIDLHRHLDGSVRLQTILELGKQYHLALPAWDLEGLRPYVQVTDPQPGVMAFIERFQWMTGVLVDYEACRRITYENVEDARSEGIDYIELRFSPWFMSEAFHLDPGGVTQAVIDGAEAGQRDFGVRTQLLGIISRTYGPEIAWKELNALLSHRDHLVGLDLAGDEAHFPGELFVEHFRRARDAGLHITVHAGESAGAGSIWQALNDLGAERIGHAVHAVDDPALMDELAKRRIGVETNLTSNVQTSTVDNFAAHPLKRFLEHGILATINTDDPGISGIDLPHEYETAARLAGLSVEQARQAQRNALAVAFLSEDEKRALAATSRPPA